MKSLIIAAVAALSLLNMPAADAQQLKVSTGSPKGTYAAELREMQQVCASDVAMVPVESSGAVENLERLLNNEVNMAFVQSDLLYRRARTQDLGGVKTLLALHKEQLHFIARPGLTITTGQKTVMGTAVPGTGTEAKVVDVSQIAGLRLAAGGGAVETARQFKSDSDINYTLIDAKDGDGALAALAAKTADVALLVGGQPLGNLTALTKDYTILAVPPGVAEKVKGAYKPARVSYSKMGAQGVPTVSIDALLVTREYKTAKMVEALGKFRNCVLGKIDELKETTGTHPAWQTVDASNKGTWNWYELPTTTAAKK